MFAFPALRRLFRSGRGGAEAAADRLWSDIEGDERYRELRQALGRAESENEAKSRFLAVASHEIRTPLNGLLGLAAVLQETDLTPEQQNFVRAIRASGGLLLGIVDDILDIARIEAGNLALEPTPANPGELVQEIVELLATRAFARGIDLVAHVSPEMPSLVQVDAPRLRQVLLNLIGNAIKYTERGGVLVSVSFEDGESAGRIGFAVADSGTGMDPGVRDGLSGKAAGRSAPASRPHHGAGLGLPIAAEIVRRMGGEIVFAPREGGGTVASFWLPVGKSGPAFPRAAGGEGRRALILAPESFGAEMLVRALADRGIESRHVAAPARAAALAAAAAAAGSAYDYLFVDARSASAPAETLATIREAAGGRIPAAILIEPGKRRSVPAIREAGYDAYLVRPVRQASLARIVEILGTGAPFHRDPADEKPPARLVGRAPAVLSALVVDDNEINGLLLRTVLERIGHNVTECHDGREALAMARNRAFDVVLLDLDLPGLGGLAIAELLKQEPFERRPTLIAVTGADAAVRERALARGFDGFLEKPVTPDALRDLLDRLDIRPAA